MKFEDIEEHSAASFVIQDVIMKLITRMHDLTLQTKLKLTLNFSKTLNSELKTFLLKLLKSLIDTIQSATSLFASLEARSTLYSRVSQ